MTHCAQNYAYNCEWGLGRTYNELGISLMIFVTVKMAKQSSEKFQKVSELSCKSLTQKIYAVVESLSCPFVSVFEPSHLDCSRSISALAQSFSHIDRLLVGPVPCG